ncbi:universal stress protein [Streptomyces sp. NBC_00893]|uniref:universal stress protein n=1 Tax=Streptomyces sp. NBC_00893 TaxID=2975862 RepID=UPI00224FADA6|nr:universal stress protein [Streptomyces sp. NBC_00893]MCX4847262.1 universal stress protein [Streptomyces sp. NBC_00893]
MTVPVTVGLNGTPASMTAADWGAREAALRGLPLRLVSAWEWQPFSYAPLAGNEMPEQWSVRVPEETAAELRRRYPGLDITADRLTGPPPEVLCEAAKESELLALGSTGLGPLAGFLLGSVAMATVAHTGRPVVLVRAREGEGDGAGEDPGGEAGSGSGGDDDGVGGGASEAGDGAVVLGIDLSSPGDETIRFGFAAAAVRSAPLRVINGWNPPPYFGHGIGDDEGRRAEAIDRAAESMRAVLAPWRERYPAVEVAEEPGIGRPARLLSEAGAGAGLVVVGRRATPRRPGQPRIGHVAHAVLHHCPAPVAVVPSAA